MPRFLPVLLALLAGLFLPASACEESGKSVRLISWNIEWYPGKTRFARREQIESHAKIVQEELRRLDPDILLAQEMRDWQRFAELCDALPGMRPVVVSAFPSEETGELWPQQLAIGSKLPVTAAWSEPWKAGEIHPRRGFAAAAVRVPGGNKVLLVYSLHLKSNRGDDEEAARLNYRTREESARQLLEHVREMEATLFKNRIAGVVVGGDFNTNQDGQFEDRTFEIMAVGGFHHTWAGVPREKRLTWRGSDRFEATTFDHFFTKGLGEPAAEMLEGNEAASDHRPVLLTVEVP